MHAITTPRPTASPRKPAPRRDRKRALRDSIMIADAWELVCPPVELLDADFDQLELFGSIR